MASSVRDTAQNTSSQAFSIALRLLTGLILGYVLGLIAQEIIGFGAFSLSFFVLIMALLFFKISSSWTILKIILFDVFCVLVLQILKMYILLAP